MQEEAPLKPIILVYFRVRGKLQPIRNLVCFLGLPIFEVYICDEEQKKKLSAQILNSLRGLKIDKTSLPLLVHEGHHIYETFPIMNYICRRFNAQDLMGRDIKQRARVNEMLDILITKEVASVGEMFRLAQSSIGKTDDEIIKYKLQLYEHWINNSGYIAEICDYLFVTQDRGGFIFGQITLIDFFFIQTANAFLGVFSNLVDQNRLLLDRYQKMLTPPRDLGGMKHFRAIQNYKNHIESQPFYINHKNYLESFSMACTQFSKERKAGLQRIWTYLPSLVQ